MLKSEWGKVMVQMKYVSLYITFILRVVELHYISGGIPVQTITSVWTTGLPGHLLFSQISQLSILLPSPGYFIIYYPFGSYSYNVSAETVVVTLWLWCSTQGCLPLRLGWLNCVGQEYKSCSRRGLTSQGFTKHTKSVMSHSYLDKLGEFWFPKSRASPRLIPCTATSVVQTRAQTLPWICAAQKDLKWDSERF